MQRNEKNYTEYYPILLVFWYFWSFENRENVFKNLRFKKSIRKHSNNAIHRDFVSLTEAKSAGILVSSSDFEAKELAYFIAELNTNGLEVQVFEFIPKLDKKNPKYMSQTVFTYQDFDRSGEISSERIKKFINIPFDYLFCLNTSSFLPFETLAVHCKAKCRIGNMQLYNKKSLEIGIGLKENEELSQLLKEMLRYLQLIRKK